MPASRRRQRERAFFYGSLLVLLLFGLLQAKTDVTLAGNESTRFATIRAIAEQNTFAIDGKVFRSVDRVVRDGKVYSDKPPLLPLLLGAACKIPVTLFGWSFEEQYGLLIYLVNFLFFTGINLAIFFLFYRRLRRMKGTFYVRWLLAFSLCAGSWLLSYSVTINNHTPAALLLLLWFLLLEEACRTRGHGAALGAGLAAGLAFTIEVPVGAIIGLAGLPAVFRTAVEGRDWRFPAAYCLGGAVTAALFPVVNYLAFGTVMPLYLAGTGTYQPGAAFHFQGVYWWETLFGRRGLFSYQPLVLGALLALLGGRGMSRPDKALAGGCGAIIVFYLTFTNEYGGWAYGFRYLVAVLPGLWFLAARYWLPVCRGIRRQVFLTLLAGIGFCTAVVGSYNPFCSGYEGYRSPPGTIDHEVRNSFAANLLAASFERDSESFLCRMLFRFYGEPVALRYLYEAYTNTKNIGMLATVHDRLQEFYAKKE